MKHSRLSDSELFEQTLNAAQSEQASTIVLLEYLAEVDRRRIYALRGFSSLWEFAHHALGYSEAQASDRVNAARLMAKIPEVKVALEEGRLTLTAGAKIGSFVRREKTSRADAISLLESCSGKSSREVEKILLPLETQPRKDMIRPITQETTRISFDADEEFMRLFQRGREVHGNLGAGVKEILTIALSAYVKKKDLRTPDGCDDGQGRLRTSLEKTTSKRNDSAKTTSTPTPDVPRSVGAIAMPENHPIACDESPTEKVARAPAPAKRSDLQKYITVGVRLQIQARAENRCEYRSSETGRRCEARHGLEFDHIPRAFGGDNSEENLRFVCRTHNLFYAELVYGREKIQWEISEERKNRQRRHQS